MINNDESSYPVEINIFADLCIENNLLLNISKTKQPDSKILKDNTHPATVSSPCCHLTTDTQVSAAVPQDYRAASGNTVGGACSGLWVLTNHSRLGFCRKGALKWSIMKEGGRGAAAIDSRRKNNYCFFNIITSIHFVVGNQNKNVNLKIYGTIHECSLQGPQNKH